MMSMPPEPHADPVDESRAAPERLAAREGPVRVSQSEAEKLLHAAEIWRRTFDAVPDLIALIDSEHRIVRVNRAMATRLGRSPQGCLGAFCFECVHHLASPPESCPHTQTLRDRQLHTAEVFEPALGGHFVVTTTPLADETGRFLGSVHVAHDITERKRAEEALAEHARYLEAARRVSFEITQELNLDTVLGLIAERACQLTGAAAADIDLWDSERQLLVPDTSYGHASPRPTIPRRLGEGAMGTVAQTRRGMIINDYRSSPVAHPDTLASTQIVAALVEPLLYRDRLLGVIAVDHETTGRVFTDRDQATLRLFAAQAAIAIENARLFTVETVSRQRLESLRAVGAAIAGELDLSRVLRLIALEAATLLHGGGGAVYLWEAAAERLTIGGRHGPQPERFATQPIALGEGLVGRVARSQRGQVVNDYRTWEGARPSILGQTTITAAIAEPLLSQGQLLGVLVVDNEGTQKQFTPQDQDLLHLFASHATIAIENARLHEQVTLRLRGQEALTRLSGVISASLDIQAVLREIARAAQELIGDVRVTFWTVDEATRTLTPRAYSDAEILEYPHTSLRFGEGGVGWVAERRELLNVPDRFTDPRFRAQAWARKNKFVSFLGLPVCLGDRLLAVLVLNGREPFQLTPGAAQLLDSFVAHAAIAVENARLYSELKVSYEQLRAAQAELIRTEKLRGLGQMAAGIAHDLNNMLATVLGQTELAKFGNPAPELREILGLIETAAADGAAVVRRLRDFARPRGTSPLAPCDLRALVQEVVEFTRPRWQDEPQRRGRVIVMEVALPEVLPPILANPPEIREALTNMIFNAVDAMPEGGRLRLEVRVSEGAAGEGVTAEAGVELAVSDTGVGMSPEVQARVFDPFFTTKGVKGTGLGLAVVYGIMERHGGTIAVTSALGQGTTFVLGFQRSFEVPAPNAEPHPAAPSTPGRRLLVVDDEPLVRQTLATLLQTAGHTVTEAADGPSALAILATTPVDVVCTDLGMPGMSGWELAGAIKRHDPHLPVLLLTGWQEHVTEDEANRQHVDAILGKPVKLSELSTALASLIRRREPGTT